MDKIQQTIQKAEAKCQQKGLKLTHKRKLVLTSLVANEKAMSAYEISDYIKSELNESLLAMSVYRILDFLQQEQLVHKLNLANKYVACKHINCKHSHQVPQFLICGKCLSVKEINLKNITAQELEKDLKQTGYQLVSPQIELNCICDNCTEEAA